MDKVFSNKTILITGGTGSFGNTVMKRLLKFPVREIRIFSRDEKKQDEMRSKLNNPKIKFFIGDIREANRVNEVMKGVDFVFHAAALKQVPSCEFYPMEAVRTNVLGAENVMNAAIAHGVERVVVLSTDKAVYPINAMGMSKALMEKLMTAKARMQEPNETMLCATRYGNVMASRGSVIPLFVNQIKEGKPVTITDPSMTRFLMSLEDSVDLVLYAFQEGVQGDIFVQKSPACTVAVLAQALKELFKSNTEIRYIGPRHAEKAFETLVSSEERAISEDLGGYYRVPLDDRELNYTRFFAEGEKTLSDIEPYTSHNTRRLDIEEVKKVLLQLDYIQSQLSLRPTPVSEDRLLA